MTAVTPRKTIPIAAGDRARDLLGQHVLLEPDVEVRGPLAEHRERRRERERHRDEGHEREERGVAQAARELETALLVEALARGFRHSEDGTGFAHIAMIPFTP